MNQSIRSRGGGLHILSVLFLAVAVIHLGGEQVRAQEVRVDCGSSYSSLGNWNVFWFAQNRTNLTEFTTGQGSGIDLTVSGWTHASTGYYSWPYASMDWVTPAAVGQGGWSRMTPGVSTATFTNLTGPLWRVEILSSMDPRVVQAFIQDITVNGLFADADYRGLGVNGDDFDSVVDGQVEANWLIWTGVRPDTGALTIQFDSTQYGDGHIMNAVRLVRVPEPATLGLLAGGVAALTARRRRRRKAMSKSGSRMSNAEHPVLKRPDVGLANGTGELHEGVLRGFRRVLPFRPIASADKGKRVMRVITIMALLALFGAPVCAATPAAGDLFVSNYFGSVVHHYDGRTFSYLGTFATGIGGPVGLAFLKNGDLAVAASQENRILRFDGKTGAYEGVIFDDAIPNPRGIAIATDGILWIPALDGGTVVGVNPDTGAEIRRFAVSRPQSVAVGNGRLYVGSQSDAVYQFDLTTGQSVGKLVEGLGATLQAMCVAPDGSLLGIGYLIGIVRIDWQTGELLATNDAFDQEGIALGPDGLVYSKVSTGSHAGWLASLDPLTLAVQDYVVGSFKGNHGLAFAPIPEPATLALLAAGLGAVWMGKRRGTRLRRGFGGQAPGRSNGVKE